MAIGYLIGAFDLLNVSDLDVIDQALSRCDELSVNVLDDDAVEQLYGRPAVIPAAERAELVGHVRGVAAVTVYDEAQHDRGQEEAQMIFAEAGCPMPPSAEAAGVVWLETRRRISSAVVREALSVRALDGPDESAA